MAPRPPSLPTQRAHTARNGVAAALFSVALAGAALAPAALLPSGVPAAAASEGPAPPAIPVLAAAPPAPRGTPAAATGAVVERQRATRHAMLEHGVITIAAQAAPRAEVARELAAATGVDPHSAGAALAAARPLTLHWRGQDAAEAWRLVLGAGVSHALQCRGERCRLWLAAVLAPTTAMDHAAPAPWEADPTAAGTEDAAPADAADGAEPAPPPWEPLQPDPPGLFPAD